MWCRGGLNAPLLGYMAHGTKKPTKSVPSHHFCGCSIRSVRRQQRARRPLRIAPILSKLPASFPLSLVPLDTPLSPTLQVTSSFRVHVDSCPTTYNMLIYGSPNSSGFIAHTNSSPIPQPRDIKRHAFEKQLHLSAATSRRSLSLPTPP